MKFDHNPPLDLPFTEYDRREIFNAIVQTNPPGSKLVLSVDHELPHSPGLTWDVETHFYVVELDPSDGEGSTWVLFVIDWDDNDGIWQRYVFKGISGVASAHQAADLLLAAFWESLNLDEDDPWAEVLKPFRDRAAKVKGDSV